MTQDVRITLSLLDGTTAPGVCGLYREIYGGDFPIPSVYDPQALVEANREGRQVNLVALNGDHVVGQAVTVRSPWNPHLYEMVGLMALPEVRSLGLGKRLALGLLEDVFPSLDWVARYTESTTAHVNSQRVDIRMGHVHSALALNILPPEAFIHDGVFRAKGRVSCVLSFFENIECPVVTSTLPARYSACLQALGRDLRERHFEEDDAHLAGETSLQVIPFAGAGTAYVAVGSLGADLGARLDAVLPGLAHMASVQLQLPLAAGVTEAVEAARARGFSLGGFLPHWFPDGDGLLLQRTVAEPDWESIQVLPGRGTELLEAVRLDREAL